MSVDYTTTALLSAVKRKAFLPTAASLTDTEILEIADEEMRSVVIPALLTVREDYYMEQADYTITPNVDTIEVLTDSFSSTMASASLVSVETGRAWALPRVPVERIDDYAGKAASRPYAYALQGETVFLLPTPTTAECLLRIRFERLPGRLVATSAGFQPIAVDTGTMTITGSSVPGAWNIGSRVSAWNSQPAFGASFIDARVTAVTGTTVTVSSPVTGTLSDVVYNGASPSERRDYPDWICLWNETCVVPLPDSWHPVLVASAAAAVLSTQGATAQSDRLYAERESKIAAMIKASSNRVRKQAPRAFNRNSPTRYGPNRWLTGGFNGS